ncbi:hypothetical protein KI387_021074, partial [Taxus chinensis]
DVGLLEKIQKMEADMVQLRATDQMWDFKLVARHLVHGKALFQDTTALRRSLTSWLNCFLSLHSGLRRSGLMSLSARQSLSM